MHACVCCLWTLSWSLPSEICFLLLEVQVSPSFPFLLLGLHVFVCVCFRKSCFDFPSSACLVLLCRSLPPSFGGGEAGEPEMSLVLLSPPTPPRVSPAANISMECPATTLESRGGARLLHGSLLRRYLPAPLPSSVAGVALHRVASLGGGGSRRSLVVWAGCREPPGGRFYIIPPL